MSASRSVSSSLRFDTREMHAFAVVKSDTAHFDVQRFAPDFSALQVAPDTAPTQIFRSRTRAVLIVMGKGEEERGLQLADLILRLPTAPRVGLIVENSSENLAIRALRIGVHGYWRAPAAGPDLVAFLEAASADSPMQGRRRAPVSTFTAMAPPPIFVGVPQSPALQGLLRQVARTEVTVLITGETGTGKEMAAQFIHASGPRRNGPLVSVNCAALPEGLLESELFGHERGAFTGAFQSRAGQIEQADGGTVLLDEVGDLPLSAQAKVLRLLENRSLQRLGGRGTVPVNVRFIAATNRPLEQMIREGRFRQDLYYRLNVMQIHMPPLRERGDEIPDLVRYLVTRLNAEYRKSVSAVTHEALRRLLSYPWPGNIRELRNVMESIYVTLTSNRIDVTDLPAHIQSPQQGSAFSKNEREEIVCVLAQTGWNKSKAAKLLHWSRMTLYRKLDKYHIA